MKKLLIVSGDSYTAKDFTAAMNPDYDCSFTKWPELLAEKLNMKCVNLAKVGGGNEFIYSTILDKINMIENKKDIGLVLVGWTQAQRKDFQTGYKFETWRNRRIDSNGDIFGWTRKSIRNFINLQLLCENFDLPYKQFQMINLYEDFIEGLKPSHRQIIEEGYSTDYRFTYSGNKFEDKIKLFNITTKYENILNTKNFLGWPILKELKGYVVANTVLKTKINNLDVWNPNLIISNLDNHPNAQGHKKIAEFIYDRLG